MFRLHACKNQYHSWLISAVQPIDRLICLNSAWQCKKKKKAQKPCITGRGLNCILFPCFSNHLWSAFISLLPVPCAVPAEPASLQANTHTTTVWSTILWKETAAVSPGRRARSLILSLSYCRNISTTKRSSLGSTWTRWPFYLYTVFFAIVRHPWSFADTETSNHIYVYTMS